MSQPANQATTSVSASGSTANPRRTSLASIEDFGQLPGLRASQGPREYATDLPMVTANPRRTVLSVAPAPRRPRD
ncbi:hypothetical protein OHV05_22775 [Kitasatospora sp. NBC_00070]|uniref:hypothetical protein n=1 Tax=Kitasatospora sp. NBC_00070 TaxID=2975962 RepID=UPI003245D5FC